MEERKPSKQRRYAVLSKETVQMFGETVGHSDTSDEVAAVLAEDVTYRLRELIQNSCQFMKHARRKKLNTEDFNKALRNSDVQPVFGHGSSEIPTFRQTREGDIHFVEDMERYLHDIAASSHIPGDIGKTTVSATWLAVEGIHQAPVPTHGKPVNKPLKAVSEDLLSYYDNITKAILGSDVELMKIALVDLRTNAKIAPLLPYFVNFVSNGVKTVSHDIGQLTRLLHTVRALVDNQSLYLEPKPYLNMLVQSVLYCVIEPLAASINPLNDHWALRDYAARLLAHITSDWDTPMNHMKQENINALQEVLYDLARPFCSHYGAVMGLTAFGVQAVEDILLPHLPNYWPHLHNIMEDTSYANGQVKADAHKVLGAMLLAAEYVILGRSQSIINQWQADVEQMRTEQVPATEDPRLAGAEDRPANQAGPSTSTPVKPGKDMQFLDGDLIGPVLQLPETTNPFKIISDLYQELYEYFGDSLAAKLPIRHLPNIYVRREKQVYVSLGDEESKKSGEELLEQLLNAATPERPASPLDDLAMKSENHSYEQTIEGMDLDEKSERSERSEQSSRSSRSYRSHSDENLSFLGDDTDLTVKATVSDPAMGIKLTITKRPKTKGVSPVRLAAPSLAAESPDAEPRRKKLKQTRMGELFEPAAHVVHVETDPSRDLSFTFRFQGREQRCVNRGRRMQHSLCCSASDSHLAALQNDCHKLSMMMRPYGRHRRAARPHSARRSRSAMHLFSSDVNNVL